MPREIKNVSYDFSGQVAVVTGAGRGQGRTHALGFAAAGADVVICEVGSQFQSVKYPLSNESELEQVAEECRALGVRALPVVCDVRDDGQVRTMVSAAIAEFGRIDVLVSNAAIESIVLVSQMSEETWDEMLDTNLKGAFLCSKHVSEHMVAAGRGSIVLVGSTASFGGVPRNAHYAAAKHGLVGFCKSLAIELAPAGINVNIACPGGVDTPMVEGILNGEFPEWEAEFGKLVGAGNLFEDGTLMEPSEITQGVMFLASDAAKNITGAELKIDAGFTSK